MDRMLNSKFRSHQRDVEDFVDAVGNDDLMGHYITLTSLKFDHSMLHNHEHPLFPPPHYI